MKIDVSLFGPIETASVNLAPLTIIAGENNTGKTFFAKGLYSVLYPILMLDPVLLRVKEVGKQSFYLFHFAFRKIPWLSKKDKEILGRIKYIFEEITKKIPDLNSREDIKDDIDKLSYEVERFVEIDRNKTRKYKYKQEFKEQFFDVLSLFKSIVSNPMLFYKQAYEKSIYKSFLSNFMVNSVSDLVSFVTTNENKCFWNFQDIFRIEIKTEGGVGVKIYSLSDLKEIKKRFKTVYYFESPVICKLQYIYKLYKNFSGNIIELMSEIFGLNRIVLFPQYIESFFDRLSLLYLNDKQPFKIKEEFDEEMKCLIEEIKGRIIYDPEKEKFAFQPTTDTFSKSSSKSSSKMIDASITSSGTLNLGFLAFFLENDYINANSLVFLEEPEVHLHPKWQVMLAEILVRLACKGAYFVVTTHSIEFIMAVKRALEAKDLIEQDFVSLNLFPFDREFERFSNREKFDQILSALSEPFARMYLQGLC